MKRQGVLKHVLLYASVIGLLLYGSPMIQAKNSLKKYRSRRTFSKTSEPKGSLKKIKKQTLSESIFVIQKHKARSLHYDFRLEIDGVLVSWAVPKGLPRKIGQKRLAVQTENHPLEYATFQGTIPEGNYGAGTVTIVDSGVYINIKTYDDQLISMSKALSNGTIEICLEGKKYKGCYALIHVKLQNEHDWLLIRIKKRDKKQNIKLAKINTI